MKENTEKYSVPHCDGCEYLKTYDYMYKNYYCDNEDRIDDMGKLGTEYLPKVSPEWCPKKVKANKVLKEQYNIKSDGYPNVIIEDE